ncbi:MAG: crotonase/enoyl-CoA hydratase family protein [Deltaproteobacteria bacterium]
MSYETILTELSEGVFTITLNRPERLNAYNAQMFHDLMAAFDESDTNDEIRVVIITGAGRGFCAGADLGGGGKTFDGTRAKRENETRAPRDTGGRNTLRIFQSLKPVIAAINGPAVGVGATLTLPMDIRLASTKAKIGFVFARRGIVPEACSSFFLPRVVGINTAMEWVATGRVFPASEALQRGLVSEVLEPDALLPRARELALEIARNTSALSVALARQMMWRMLGATHPMDAHRLDSNAMFQMGRSADAKEGVTSFLEKRAAEFPGKVSTDLPEIFEDWPDPAY